jgi:hypothetical protein
MAKKEQTPRKTPSGEWVYVTISAKPEEREAYRQIAALDSRSVSWWIRDVLNKEVARRKASSNNETQLEGANSTVGLETVSPDRA